jgi:prepilin-type N-terminal cleavage/methylation domain-containing protein
MKSLSRSATAGHPTRAAFTLVELLVVIAIIAILAAIIFPAFAGVQENVRRANCMDNLRKLYVAVNQYQLDNRQYPEYLFGPALNADGTLATSGTTAGMTPSQVAADLRSTITATTATADANRIRNVQQLYQKSLFPSYINDLSVYTCPDNPITSPTAADIFLISNRLRQGDTTAGEDPNATKIGILDADDMTNRTTVAFYKFDSYDANAAIINANNSWSISTTMGQPRYERVWTTLLDRTDLDQLSPDLRITYQNQMVFRNPSSDTFLTMCPYHVSKSKIVVTWLNGNPKVLDNQKLNNANFQPASGSNRDYDMYKMTPSNY